MIKLKESDDSIRYLIPQAIPWNIIVSEPTPACGAVSNFALLPLWTNETGDLPEDNFVESGGLLNYLQGDSFSTKEAEDLWGSEFQVGIEKSAQRTAEIGKIYSVEFIRLKEEEKWQFFASGFLVDFVLDKKYIEEKKLKPEGFLALGGESRAAKYETIQDEQIAQSDKLTMGDFLNDALTDSNKFKLYLASPAIFNNGWYPDFLGLVDGELIGEIDNLRFRLISAVVNKPQTISGWNVAEKKPRPVVKAVPAGSVYYFELMDNLRFEQTSIDLIRTEFHYQVLTGLGDKGIGCLKQEELKRYGKAGFGLAFVGKVSEV